MSGINSETLIKFEAILKKIKTGIPAHVAIPLCRLSSTSFYNVKNSDEKHKKDYEEALATAVNNITQELLADTKSTAGKIFVASRGFSKFYGKFKEEEMQLDISDETRKVMTDDNSTGEQKIAALNKDFYANKIQLPLFEKLVGIVKLSHPEMSKTELSGEIKIYDALVPTR